MKEIADTIRATYDVPVELTDTTMNVLFEEFPGSLGVEYANDEYTIYGEAWHEHIATPEHLKEFLSALFSGEAQVVVTYRGERTVAHRVQRKIDGTFKTTSYGGILHLLNWRPKVRKIMNYRLANKAL